jgi:hypothetical protein
MDADGTNVLRLTVDPAIDQAPNWQALPDPGPQFDTDSDGCYDSQELGANAIAGGLRDPQSFWDFFDTPNAANVRDRGVASTDFFRVIGRFGASGDTGIDPLSAPLPPPAYHTAFDRSPPTEGADPWDLAPPNGSISSTDFFEVLAQFGHTCA